jgi:hypothetical protein
MRSQVTHEGSADRRHAAVFDSWDYQRLCLELP